MSALSVALLAWFTSVNVIVRVIPVGALPGLPQAFSNNAVTLVYRFGVDHRVPCTLHR